MNRLEIIESVEYLNKKYSGGFIYELSYEYELLKYNDYILWEIGEEFNLLEIEKKFKKYICHIFGTILNTEGDFKGFLKELLTILNNYRNKR